MAKDLSVIVVNYKTPSLLRQCIKSIQKNPPSCNYDIIVVDNNSEDETVEMMEDDFPEVVLIANEKNLGFPKAVNQALRKSDSKYILLLNPDITVLGESLDKMMAYLNVKESIAVLGPKLINPNGSIQYSCFKWFTSPRVALYRRTPFGKLTRQKELVDDFLMADWDHKESREVAWILGSCMMVRRKAIDQVGLMDERFFMYMEDVDWCRRFWQKGWKVFYFPEVEVVHYYARASASESNIFLSMFNRQTRIHIKSAIKYFFKYLNEDKKKRAPIIK
ncbi:MAG: glycosyltransferase family 2 protein [Parcubacteria group bacterium]|nr:glycosyltransferase family 2 protein [Parcubacteria group bacterium]